MKRIILFLFFLALGLLSISCGKISIGSSAQTGAEAQDSLTPAIPPDPYQKIAGWYESPRVGQTASLAGNDQYNVLHVSSKRMEQRQCLKALSGQYSVGSVNVDFTLNGSDVQLTTPVVTVKEIKWDENFSTIEWVTANMHNGRHISYTYTKKSGLSALPSCPRP